MYGINGFNPRMPQGPRGMQGGPQRPGDPQGPRGMQGGPQRPGDPQGPRGMQYSNNPMSMLGSIFRFPPGM